MALLNSLIPPTRPNDQEMAQRISPRITDEETVSITNLRKRLPLSHEWKGLLFFATTTVLVVELMNSAIESVVDLASPDYHLLAKRAKDIGSAAVFVSIALTVFLWIGAFFSILLSKP